MRFYDVKEGEIILDGKNVKDHPTKKLRQKFGIVFQNDFLFADKISENVKFGRDISDDEVEKALSLAQASEFVSSYDDKSDHELEIKGANLSGGQKQRLLIARALADSPEILILDDSSSALDYKTDSLLRKALANNLTDSTVIIVAQRISSIMHADLILVLDEGRIIGKGTHEELISSCPIYSQISESQMGGMLVE
jgi:ATP-binding cassette subfamily B protein